MRARAVGVSDLERLLQRGFRIAVLLEPVRGTASQLLGQLGLGLEELSAQEIAEEVVISGTTSRVRRAGRGKGSSA